MSANLKLVTSTTEKRTIATPRRRPNKELRTREHLTKDEVERLMAAARKNREGARDATMILVAFRHGLRASELTDLRWDQVDFNHGVLHVRQVKNGSPATHPLDGEELRALRRLRRKSPESPFVFVSMRGAPFTVSGFRRMVERAGQDAGSRSRLIRTCFAMRLASPWRTRASIRGPCKPTSATRTFSTRFAIPSCQRRASRGSGIEQSLFTRSGRASYRRRRSAGRPFSRRPVK